MESPPSNSESLTLLSQIQNQNLTYEAAILNLPRRRCAYDKRDEAAFLAQAFYPDFTPTKALIQYDNLLRNAKACIRNERAKRLEEAKRRKEKSLAVQGPWKGQVIDPLDLKGPKGLAMPVRIGEEADFRPVFEFLREGGNVCDILSQPNKEEETEDGNASIMGARQTIELQWGTPCLEFPRGIIYADGRLDLCKMVVGPTHIESLMSALERNKHITQFLLGNNVISTTGAKSIAQFIEKCPDRIETWYIAGCHITAPAFRPLVNAMVRSKTITNIWLKRNPLTSSSVTDLGRLIEQSLRLRTLDLENVELGDVGVMRLFALLEGKQVALRNIYLNANGMGVEACKAFAKVLAHPACQLESIFMASNPIGDAGMQFLAPAFAECRSLQRVGLQSTGLTSHGVIQLADAVREGGSVFSLDIGPSQTTAVHNQRYNHIDDTAASALEKLIESPQLRWLNLGRTPLSPSCFNRIQQSVSKSSLVYFKAYHIPTADEKLIPFCPLALDQTLMNNVKRFYPKYDSYTSFEHGEDCRFLRNTPDVRLIDSMYRTRDRRMNIEVDPVWPVGDETWKLVVEDAEQEV